MPDEVAPPDWAGYLDLIEAFLLGEPPTLTRHQLSELSGVPTEEAAELWRELGFPQVPDDVVAFTPADADAEREAQELINLGILSEDRKAALVRTWGRSYARLAEWQSALLLDVATERKGNPTDELVWLAAEIVPRVERLQAYVWRRHLISAAARIVADPEALGSAKQQLAVGFVDIVGYTARSKTLSEEDLVAWIEQFEDAMTHLVTDAGGRVIKNLGDAVLYVCESPLAAAEVALTAVTRGADDEDSFPEVRAGVAYGDVVTRLGDVFGPTVNIASRLTSVARPSTVVVDEGMVDELEDVPTIETRKLRRVGVKGYSRLTMWHLRSAGGS
ncbi:adenylate/guanylate cyclase domain-containing protein [Nocardioides baekrokdamisoli]|uniref:Adenylate/guanylate cyclase domain-containing protein n=1 Tax=Nocardioides baekrokdamisoli TaxID=1804624 RepID=A0A3G9IEI9_9ACTN|nr:adenylate/guanylate cyclase domain-containing protein [Nocardioides baekrokdamisoli]BBH17327.1 adenylate/guanylate cyclase domain-containing protein [Nocardioides baekrokdamisoli]